ncbi:ElaA protein [Flavobacteriaceae bacterium MAR_2010_188]|nr:ElaA protein [Flavobacteriaceae bacterium MAR_2010_188]
MLNCLIKSFEELSIYELYELLRLRTEIFVVEQDCVYQDLDNKDQLGKHVLGYEDDKLVAYTRIFKSGIYFKEASIGRVIVKKEFRYFGYGYDIMNASIDAIKDEYDESRIRISAQSYLKKFYGSFGFVAKGKEYLEDGIPHFKMVLDKKKSAS